MTSFPLVLLRGGDHLLAFGGEHGHGLLADDVTPGVKRIDGRRRVYAVRCANAHAVRLHFLEHFLPVFVELGDAPLFSKDFETSRVNVDARDDFHVGHLRQRGHMGMADSAAANKGHAKLLALVLLLNLDCQ